MHCSLLRMLKNSLSRINYNNLLIYVKRSAIAGRFYFIKYLFTLKKYLAALYKRIIVIRKTIDCFGNCRFYNNYSKRLNPH